VSETNPDVSETESAPMSGAHAIAPIYRTQHVGVCCARPNLWPFVCFNVGAQHGIDARLVARPHASEKLQHVAIDAQCDLLFRVREIDRLRPYSIRL